MDYLGHVERDGAALLDAARSAPQARIPSCPAWDMAALVGHVGAVHGWAAVMVATRATQRAQFPNPPEGWDELLSWYDQGLATLLAELTAVGPDELVWNWGDRAPGPARFWLRRMAHETAVHRWDAENAAGSPAALPIDAALAADGIDEYLGFVAGWLARRPVEGLRGRLGLDPTEGPAGPRTIALATDHFEVTDGLDGADVTVTGTPSDLLLWMTNRGAPGLRIEGDETVSRAWQQGVVFD